MYAIADWDYNETYINKTQNFKNSIWLDGRHVRRYIFGCESTKVYPIYVKFCTKTQWRLNAENFEFWQLKISAVRD